MSLGLRFLLFSFLICFLTSCYHEQATMATIIIKDNSGNLIEDAQVRLYAEPTVNNIENSLSIDLIKLTNSKGEAYFNLSNIYDPGQNGVGVFAVNCEKLNLSGDTIIEIYQETNNIVELKIE